MPVKLIMSWNIQRGQETDYSEFVVNEFIPRLKRLGLGDIEFWYTRYGECEQIQASGISPDLDQVQRIVRSEEFGALRDRLDAYVSDYDQKLVKATRGFQL